MTVTRGDIWNVGLAIAGALISPAIDILTALQDGMGTPDFDYSRWAVASVGSLMGALMLWYQSRHNGSNDEPVVG